MTTLIISLLVILVLVVTSIYCFEDACNWPKVGDKITVLRGRPSLEESLLTVADSIVESSKVKYVVFDDSGVTNLIGPALLSKLGVKFVTQKELDDIILEDKIREVIRAEKEGLTTSVPISGDTFVFDSCPVVKAEKLRKKK